MAAALALAAVVLLVLLAAFALAAGRGAGAWPAAGLLFGQYSVGRARPVRALDGEHYRVHGAYAAPRGAADLLARANAACIAVLAHMRGKYLRPGAPPARAEITRRLLANYDPDALAESSPHNSAGDTSYSLDKGRLVALCLRERDPRESGRPDVHDFHDLTTILFVTMHELAHLGTAGYGHPPEFWACFKLLLLESQEAGVVPGPAGSGGGAWPDYARRPARYCGLTIDYSPLSDASVAAP